jgi:alcohol dehydrogenase
LRPFERVVTGRGAFAELPAEVDRLGKRRAFILTGRALATQTELVERAERMLGDRWAGTDLDSPEPGPQCDGASALDRARLVGADLVVSFGAGGAIDAAAPVARDPARQAPQAALPRIAIPTTLSGGEFAPAAGGTGRSGCPGEVRRNRRCAPEVVLLDPEVTAATPARVWSFTGIGALDQAVECLWSPAAHPVTDTLALDAIRRLDRDLRSSLQPGQLEARLQCQIAAWMSTFGLLDVGVRLSHPLAERIGARWSVPLGIAAGIALPGVMRSLAPRTLDAQARVAGALGIAGGGRSPGQLAALAGDGVEALIGTLDLPQRLREVGADRAELAEVARAACLELTRLGSPDAGSGSESALLGILEEIW